MRTLPLLAWLCVGAATLPAQEDQKQLEETFHRLDLDKDGSLTRAEFPGSDKQFEAIDANKDHVLSLAEYLASDVAKRFLATMSKEHLEPRARVNFQGLALARLDLLARCDANHDGKVTREEWTGAPEAFTELDLDGNGVLDRRDRALATALPTPEDSAMPEPREDLPSAEELLKHFDKDKNGTLSAKEVATHKYLAEVFARADTNNDKELDEKELRLLVNLVHKLVAEHQKGRGRPHAYDVPFDEWDKDKDGKLQANEWLGGKGLFERIDLDRDSSITKDELRRYKKRVEGVDFLERFDLNGDGKVTLEEFGGPEAAFRRADRNGDGVITRSDR